MQDALQDQNTGVFLGFKLRMLRHSHNFTQEYVAENLGIKQSTLSRWEHDLDGIHIGELRKVAALYKVGVE